MRNRRNKTIGITRSSALRPSNENVNRLIPTCSQHNNNLPVTGTVTRVQYHRDWTGVRTPNFVRVKKRNLPINAHHVYTYTVFDGGYMEQGWRLPQSPTSDHDFSYGQYSFGASHTGAAPPTPTHNLSSRNAAIAKLAEVAGQNVNNIAQDLVQVNQLTRVVVDTCARITGAIKALRRRNPALAVSLLWQKKQPRFRPGGSPYTAGNSLAKNWLEYQYGWKPLLMDVEGAAKSLAYLNAGTFMVQTARSSKSATTTESQTLTLSGRNAGTRTILTKTEIQFLMRYRVGEPLDAFLTQIGFNNPINLAWEVLPYSFVIDWFLPIGQYLEGLHSWDGLVFLDGCETRFTRQSALFDVSYYYEDAVQIDTRRGNYSREAVLLDRIKLTSFPTQRLPQFKNPISATHALNGLALLRAAFSGGRFYGR